MTPIRSAIAFAAALGVASLLSAADMAEPQFVSLFNGKDLTGFKPNGNAIWTVENGVLIGRNNPKSEGGTVATEKAYKNFILEFEVKYLPPADSGITMRRPSLQMQIGTSHSYHTELTGSFYLGQLHYTDDSTSKESWKHFKPGRWNTIRLQARGSVFTVYINGQLVNRYADAGHADAGPISFQVHNNEQSKIEFKNIRIAELP